MIRYTDSNFTVKRFTTIQYVIVSVKLPHCFEGQKPSLR